MNQNLLPQSDEVYRKARDTRDIQKKKSRTFGFVGSYLTSTMTASFSASGTNYTANMKGSGYGALIYYDQIFSRPFSTRFMIGYEQFQVSEKKSTLICDGGKSTTCEVKVSYLSLYAQGKITILPYKNSFWIAGGLGEWIALSKTSTVFDSSSIGPSLVFIVSAGIDFAAGKIKIPVFVDYAILSGTATVSGDSLIARLGIAW